MSLAMQKLTLAAGLATALIVGAVAFGEMAATPATSSSTTAVPAEKRVTAAMYRDLKMGMSYFGVTEVLGREGTEVSRNHMEGIPGVMPGVMTVGVSWQNRDGSNIFIIFQNDRLVQKAQAGLR